MGSIFIFLPQFCCFIHGVEIYLPVEKEEGTLRPLFLRQNCLLLQIKAQFLGSEIHKKQTQVEKKKCGLAAFLCLGLQVTKQGTNPTTPNFHTQPCGNGQKLD